MSTQTRDVNAERDKNWVLYGDEETLGSLSKHLDMQHYLRKIARRVKRQVSSSWQKYSE